MSWFVCSGTASADSLGMIFRILFLDDSFIYNVLRQLLITGRMGHDEKQKIRRLYEGPFNVRSPRVVDMSL
jgi:hypothetical protein